MDRAAVRSEWEGELYELDVQYATGISKVGCTGSVKNSLLRGTH